MYDFVRVWQHSCIKCQRKQIYIFWETWVTYIYFFLPFIYLLLKRWLCCQKLFRPLPDLANILPEALFSSKKVQGLSNKNLQFLFYLFKYIFKCDSRVTSKTIYIWLQDILWYSTRIFLGLVLKVWNTLPSQYFVQITTSKFSHKCQIVQGFEEDSILFMNYFIVILFYTIYIIKVQILYIQ